MRPPILSYGPAYPLRRGLEEGRRRCGPMTHATNLFRVYRLRCRRRELVAVLGFSASTTLQQATFAAASVGASNRLGSELHDRTGLVRRFTRKQAGRLLPRLRRQEEERQGAVIAGVLRCGKAVCR